MKKYIIQISGLFCICLFLNACSDPDQDFNFQTDHPAQLRTVTENNFNQWTEGLFININTTHANDYTSYHMQIGDGSAEISQTTAGDPNCWMAVVHYTECKPHTGNPNKVGKTTQTIDFTVMLNTRTVNDYNEWMYSYHGKNNGIDHITFKTTEKDNFNSIKVFNNGTDYLFEIRTKANNNLNSWEFIDFKSEWWHDPGMTCLYFIPVLINIAQV